MQTQTAAVRHLINSQNDYESIAYLGEQWK